MPQRATLPAQRRVLQQHNRACADAHLAQLQHARDADRVASMPRVAVAVSRIRQAGVTMRSRLPEPDAGETPAAATRRRPTQA
ncbi:hypothetical protein LL969_12045 [Xanthomonas campestris pv. phormiicola]|nr:hypothetical protein [Xanthomonas campestris pv. phormiicola]